MSDNIERRRTDYIINWDVSVMAREIRYVYYEFVVVSYNKITISRIKFNENDVSYMLGEINKAIKNVCERDDGIDIFNHFVKHKDRLDEKRIMACNSEYISDVFINTYKYWCLSDADWSWWSKDNERAVNFVWSFIACLTNHDLCEMLDDKPPIMTHVVNNYPGGRGAYEKDVIPYKQMGFDYDLHDIHLKHDSVMRFFDFLDIYRMEFKYEYSINSRKKENIIRLIKSLWLFSIEDDSMVCWVSKNKKYLSRAWQYYLRTMEDGLVPAWYCSKYAENYTQLLILAYDLLSVDYSSKKLFMSRLAKSCAQERYRDSLSSKKQVSFLIRSDVKEKLDKLAEQKGKKLYELVEQLIEKEYEINKGK